MTRVDSRAGKMNENWFDWVVDEMASFWGENMVVSRVGSRAGWSAAKTAGWLVVNFVDGVVGQMAACWDERMILTRVGSRADKMVEETVVKRAG